MMLRWLCLTLLLHPFPGAAQAPLALDLAALIELGAEPWHDAGAFEGELAEILPGLSVQLVIDEDRSDPFAWSLSGGFAAIPDVAPIGGIISCSRMGFPTRDFLLGSEPSDRAAFRLFRLYDVEHDLAAAWPEGAVARLLCELTWDDSRAVAILSRAEVAPVLAAEHVEISDTTPSGQDAFFGTDGYRLRAEGGRRDSVVIQDRTIVTLSLRHQAVSIRSYLMNGGM